MSLLFAAVSAAFVTVTAGLKVASDGKTFAKPKCVVWHSQHKSAGREVAMRLGIFPMDPKLSQQSWRHTRACKFGCDRESWDCEKEACTEEKAGYSCEPGHQRIAFQAYTPALAGSDSWGSPGDGKCVWATMSREPVSRLISALFYCRYGWSRDPLCGDGRLNAKDASIHDWAKHWGNFLFRELMMNPQLKEAARSRASFNASAGGGNIHYCGIPWTRFKDQLNGGDDPHTKDGAQNLQAVKQALRGEGAWKPLYDVYGVVEMWNETMAQFDESLPLHGLSWVTAGTADIVDHGSSAWKKDEVTTLMEARKDPVVLKALAADIELYQEVIVPLFQRKAREASLAQKAVNAFASECSRLGADSSFCNVTLQETQKLIERT